MKSNEVNKSLIGRRVKGMCFGEMVAGTIYSIETNDHAVYVFFHLDVPLCWGGNWYHFGQAWARKADEFGSLHHMELI